MIPDHTLCIWYRVCVKKIVILILQMTYPLKSAWTFQTGSRSGRERTPCKDRQPEAYLPTWRTPFLEIILKWNMLSKKDNSKHKYCCYITSFSTKYLNMGTLRGAPKVFDNHNTSLSKYIKLINDTSIVKVMQTESLQINIINLFLF